MRVRSFILAMLAVCLAVAPAAAQIGYGTTGGSAAIGKAVTGASACGNKMLFVDGSFLLQCDPTGLSPTLTGLTLSGLSANRVVYTGASGVLSSSANLGWDGTTFNAGPTTSATPTSSSIYGQGGSGSNIAGANLYIGGGAGTGTGPGGSFVIQGAPAGSSGSSANAQVDYFTLASTGGVSLVNDGGASTSPLVVNEASKPVFSVAPSAGTGVNGLTLTPSVTGSAPTLAASGDDTNIGLDISPKGSGVVSVKGAQQGHEASIISTHASGYPALNWYRNTTSRVFRLQSGLDATFAAAGDNTFLYFGDVSTANLVLRGAANVATFGQGSGTSKALILNNGTSTGNIAEFQDNGTAVFTIADGGGAFLQRSVEAVTTTKSPAATESNEIYVSGDADGSTITLPNDPAVVGLVYTVVVDQTQTSNQVTLAPSAGESIINAGTAYTTSCTSTQLGASITVVNVGTGSGAKWAVIAIVGTWTCS